MHMNAKIAELISACTTESRTYSDRFGNRTETHFDKYKFAELLIAQCAEIARRHTPDLEELDYGYLIGDKIEEHFGVRNV